MLKITFFFVFTLFDAQKHADGALMTLQVLQQRILAVESQTVVADEAAHGVDLLHTLSHLILTVVVELPVEESAQLLLYQMGTARADVVPVLRMLAGHTLDGTTARQPDGQVPVA